MFQAARIRLSALRDSLSTLLLLRQTSGNPSKMNRGSIPASANFCNSSSTRLVRENGTPPRAFSKGSGGATAINDCAQSPPSMPIRMSLQCSMGLETVSFSASAQSLKACPSQPTLGREGARVSFCFFFAGEREVAIAAESTTKGFARVRRLKVAMRSREVREEQKLNAYKAPWGAGDGPKRTMRSHAGTGTLYSSDQPQDCNHEGTYVANKTYSTCRPPNIVSLSIHLTLIQQAPILVHLANLTPPSAFLAQKRQTRSQTPSKFVTINLLCDLDLPIKRHFITLV